MRMGLLAIRGARANSPIAWVLPTVVAIVSGCADQSARFKDIQDSLKKIDNDLSSLARDLPRNAEKSLSRIEDILNNPVQWPQDSPKAESLRQELESVVLDIPPIPFERILPRLTRISWGVESLWLLRTHANPRPEDLEEVQSQISDAVDRRPAREYEPLFRALTAKLADLDTKLPRYRLERLMARARKVLENQEAPGPVLAGLEEFQNEQVVAEVLPRLRSRLLEDVARERLIPLEKNLIASRKIGDDRVRQAALLTIQDGLLRLLVDLGLGDVPPKDLQERANALMKTSDDEIVAIARKEQAASADRLRRYQGWALEQVRYFDSPNGWFYDTSYPVIREQLWSFRDAKSGGPWPLLQVFPSAKEIIDQKTSVSHSSMDHGILTADARIQIYAGWERFTSLDKELAYRATRDGMVRFLLPIQQNLLDPPVLQLYQQAFNKGWQKLEGREDQLYVAKQSATVVKKSPDDEEIRDWKPSP